MIAERIGLICILLGFLVIGIGLALLLIFYSGQMANIGIAMMFIGLYIAGLGFLIDMIGKLL